jgi:D-alanyl-lipoteichoic acid acyltransferase DltB (MBOAT superfamily)
MTRFIRNKFVSVSFCRFFVVHAVLKVNYKLQLYWLLLFSLFFYTKPWDFCNSADKHSANKLLIRYLDSEERGGDFKKIVLSLALLVNLGILAYFKYANFFITTVNDLGGTEWSVLDIIIPLGISFYTFKSLTYIFDIYYEMMEPEYSFFEFLLFVTFFPKYYLRTN